MKRCLGCDHFKGGTPLYMLGAREPIIRGTCIAMPVWQSINNADAHRCGQWKVRDGLPVDQNIDRSGIAPTA